MRGFLICFAMLATACGGSTPGSDPEPRPIVTGGRYSLPATSPAVARGAAIGRLACQAPRRRVGAHLELFVGGNVVLLPSGLGIAPPLVGDAALVASGRCEYPLVTRDPTGVVELDPDVDLTLGDLFAIWGQPLGRTGFAGFAGSVRAYLDGAEQVGDPARVPVFRHAQIVLEVGRPLVSPHPRYRFPPGL